MEQKKDNSTAKRRSQIIALLDEKGQVDVQDLSDTYKVSTVTIRSDLAYLEDKNILIRTRGGAIKQTTVAMELALSEKAKENIEEKKRIGVRAAELVNDGDMIILDSGTTTMEIAKHIKKKQKLTVITHALNIITELAGSKGLEIIMPGGILHEKSFSLVGSQAEKNLLNYYCDKFFLGAYGIDSSYGVYTPCIPEAEVNRVMAKIARETIVVADSSKFGKRSLAFIVPINEINTVITDVGISEKDKQSLINQNVELIIV